MRKFAQRYVADDDDDDDISIISPIFVFLTLALQSCTVSRLVKTNYWELYNTSGTPPDFNFHTAAGSCKPYDLNLAQKEFIQNGQPVHDPEHDLFLEQKNNGNLVVQRGNKTLWESGVKGEIGDYFTRLQGDGNMITYNGTISDMGARFWKSDSSNSTGTYFLGVDCVDGETVSIYQGAPNHPGNVVWSGDPPPRNTVSW